MPVEMLVEKAGRQATGGVEKLSDTSSAKLELVCRSCAEDLDAIASRDDQSFTQEVAVDELAQSNGARFVVEGESLADLYRSSFVIDSDENDGHFFSHKKAQKAQTYLNTW